jgi:tetratricopeptide (TPR) repeat protein
MKKDRIRLLIPCYQDMDPYDLPNELSMLQCQDMAKIGFVQDLIRGVQKVLDKSVGSTDAAAFAPSTAPLQPNEANTLLKRAHFTLEDEDWRKADELLERVLDIDPENARAYIGKLMVKLKVAEEKNLPAKATALDIASLKEYKEYEKALRFADAEYRAVLEGYEQDRKEKLYQKSVIAMKTAKNVDDFYALAKSFALLSGYKDADALFEECVYKQALAEIEIMTRSSDLNVLADKFSSTKGLKNIDDLIEKCHKQAKYLNGLGYMNIGNYYLAAERFASIPGYKDADALAEKCQNEEKLQSRKEKRNLLICFFLIFGVIALVAIALSFGGS